MKITVSWKTSQQVGPEDWSVYTRVVHCEENETLKQLHDRITKPWQDKDFDCELHFDNTKEFDRIKE